MTTVIREIALTAELKGSGKTWHHRDGGFVSDQVSRLQIVQFDDCQGVYVLYLDGSGAELNDLFFDTLSAAEDHIRWEFDIEL
jgi:hypothetical protein